MKTTKITLTSAAILVAASLLITNCKKKTKETNPATPDTEQSSASDNAMAENNSNDALAMGSQLSENSGTLTTYRMIGTNNNNQSVQYTGEEFGLAAVCATITAGNNTLTPGVPASYTINFGNTGCVGLDGKTRKGMLMYDFSQSAAGANRYRKPGFKMIVTSSGYSVDGNMVAITKTVTNTSPAAIATETAYSGTDLTWSIVSNVTINKVAGGTLTWECNRTQKLINSNDPTCYKGQQQAIDWTKAKVQLDGTAGGTNANNESYSATATALVRDFTCSPDPNHPHHHPFVSGTIDYTPGQRATRHIDYGNGSCDLSATVTINGQTFTLNLP